MAYGTYSARVVVCCEDADGETAREIGVTMKVRRVRREAPQAARAEPPRDRAAFGDAPTLADAIGAFQATLAARTPRTAATYRSALSRFAELLRDRGHDPATLTPDLLPSPLLAVRRRLLRAHDIGRPRGRRTSRPGAASGARRSRPGS